MKNILSILLSFCLLSCSATNLKQSNLSQQENDEKIKNQVEKYAKDSLARKYLDFKSLSTIVTDTIQISLILKEDSLTLVDLIQKDESSLLVLPMQKEMINQIFNMKTKLKIKSIDHSIVKMYKKKNVNLKQIQNESAKFAKKVDSKKEIKNILHVFQYRNSKDKIVNDTAMFFYSPEKIRVFSTATKFEKGITFNGTITTIKNYAKEIVAKMYVEENK